MKIANRIENQIEDLTYYLNDNFTGLNLEIDSNLNDKEILIIVENKSVLSSISFATFSYSRLPFEYLE